MLTSALLLALAPQAPQASKIADYATYPLGGELSHYALQHGAIHDQFALFTPGDEQSWPAPERPLLVLFHTAGGSGLFELLNWASAYVDEADFRRWFILAPEQIDPTLGLTYTQRTYGNDAAQACTRSALQWALENLPIDRQRVYGVGFSMGGGDVLSFAAQHRDPTAGAFAAVAINAGSTSLSAEYWLNTSAQPALERAIGGGPGVLPTASPWDFARASSLVRASPHPWAELRPWQPQPARNLAGALVQGWIHRGDFPWYVSAAADLVDVFDPSLIGGPSGVDFQSFEVGAPSPTNPVHQWDSMDATAVCDAFALRDLDVPDLAEYVIARDARFGDVGVLRRDPGAFGVLSHDFRGIGNPTPFVRFPRLQNIARVAWDGGAQGLGIVAPAYEIELGGVGRLGLQLVIDNVDAPVQVSRDGIVTSSWSYDVNRRFLTLDVPRSRGEIWRVEH